MRLSPSLRTVLKNIGRDIGDIRAGIASLIAPRQDVQELISTIRNSNEADQLNREHEQSVLVSLRAKEQVRKTNERHSRRYQYKNYRIQKWLAIGTWLTFAAAAIYAAIAASTYHEIQKQTAEAQRAANAAAESAALASWSLVESEESSYFTLQQMEIQSEITKRGIDAANKNAKEALNASIKASQLDLRAWVGISGVRLLQFEEGKPIKIGVDIKNTGKTPAISVVANATYVGYNAIWKEPAQRDIDDLRRALTPQTSISPGETLTQTIEVPVSVVQPIWPKIETTYAYIYVFGIIRYKDISPDTPTHETRFCSWIDKPVNQPPSSARMSYCLGFNDMN
jgi:hypothetical protein